MAFWEQVTYSGNLLSGQVGPRHLAQNSLWSGHAGSGLIMGSLGGGPFHIASGTLGPNDLGSGAVRSGAVASGQIGNFHLSSGSVTSGRLGVTGTPSSGYILQADFSWIPQAGGGAPTDAEYLVGTANGSLSAERVVTDTTGTTGIAWDLGTAGQAKATATNAGKWIRLATATASNSATIDFTGLTSAYAAYLVVWAHVAPATDGAALCLRTSTDGGSTYDSGAGNYAYYNLNDADSASATEIRIQPSGTGNAANEHTSGVMYINNPSAAQYCTIIWEDANRDSAGTFTSNQGAGQRLAAADVDAIRFLFSSGNIASGRIDLYGLAT